MNAKNGGKESKGKPVQQTLEETLPILKRSQQYHAEQATQYGAAADLLGQLLELTREQPEGRFQKFAPGFEKFQLFVSAREAAHTPFNVASAAVAMAGTATIAPSTGAAFPSDFVLRHVNPSSIWDLDRIRQYAERLAKLDPELARNYRGVADGFLGRKENAERVAFGLARQCFDHLFSVLVPNDDEVRHSEYFVVKDSDKPKAVSRAERIKYAASLHIRDKAQAKYLIEQASELVETYKELQALHAREAIDRKAARAVLLTFMASIEQWVDALEL